METFTEFQVKVLFSADSFYKLVLNQCHEVHWKANGHTKVSVKMCAVIFIITELFHGWNLSLLVQAQIESSALLSVLIIRFKLLI